MADLIESIERILDEGAYPPGQPATIALPVETVRTLLRELADAKSAMREIQTEAEAYVEYNPMTDAAFVLIRDAARSFLEEEDTRGS